MPFELDLKYEALNYRGTYAQPSLELWGRGGVIIKGLLDSLRPYGVTLQHVQVSTNLLSAADTIIVAQIPTVGTVKFSFDKIEFNFTNFSQEFFASIPRMLNSLAAWLSATVPEFRFSSHGFVYFCHSFIKDGTPQDALLTVNSRALDSAGISAGNGMIFNYRLPSKNWETKLLIDKSEQLTGGLFMSFDMRINCGEIDYENVMLEGRRYLAGILNQLNLTLPEADRED